MPSISSNPRIRLLWKLSKLGLAALLMGFVVSRASLPAVLETFQTVSWAWLFPGAVAFVLVTCLLARRYQVLLGNALPFRQVLGVVILQNAATNLLGAGVGSVSYVALLRGAHEVPVGQGIGSLLLARIGSAAVAGLSLLLSAAVLWPQMEAFHSWVSPLRLAAVLSGILLLGAIALLIASRASTQARIQAWLAVRRDEAGAALTRRRLFSKLATPQSYHLLRSLLIYSLLILLADVVWVACTLHSFGLPVGVWPVVLVVSLTQLMAIVPAFVFGSLGIYEVTSLTIYVALGLVQSQVAAALIGLRLTLYVFTLLMLVYIPVSKWLGRPVQAAFVDVRSESPRSS